MDTRSRWNKADFYTAEQVSRVLTAVGITVSQELDSDYLIFCPFHPNNRTPAAEVNKETGMLFCFACQVTATLIETVMHVSGRSYFESARLIKSKEVETDITKEIQKRVEVKPDYVEFDQNLVNRLHEQLLESERGMSYFAGRKISAESVGKFGLGFSKTQDMVTVPVHAPNGVLIGFVGRSIVGKEFKNTPGMPKSKILFNLHRVKNEDYVFIVESSFDAIRLDQCGIPAVATLGANVSKIQIDLLKKYFNKVVLVADNDEAGNGMKNKLLGSLGSRVSMIQLDKQYKDIGDMNDEDIKKLDQTSFDKSILSMLK